MRALLETNLPLPNKRTGKVRDLYDVTLPNGDAGLLIIASDRVSVFDVVTETFTDVPIYSTYHAFKR